MGPLALAASSSHEQRDRNQLTSSVPCGGQVVRFELVTAYGKDGDTSMVTETVTYDWTTPSGWSTQDLKLVTLDAGGGFTYAGNKFEASDVIGVLVRRLGSAAQDTFSQSLIMASSFVFEYTAKQV